MHFAVGPALGNWNAFFFILQIALVWTAFFRLPYTIRPAHLSNQSLVYHPARTHKNHKVFHDLFGNELHFNRGGYLMKFCGYETFLFCGIVGLACGILYYPFEPWQRKALFYWIRSAYGLFSLPFVAFKIPVLANILMHTNRMGYNEDGETVQIRK